MITYKTKGCYVNSKYAFISVILGCIYEEIKKIDKDEEPGRRSDLRQAIAKLAYALFTTLKLEGSVARTYDCLEALENATHALKIQDEADKVVRLLQEPIELIIDASADERDNIMTFGNYLPDFKEKITVEFR